MLYQLFVTSSGSPDVTQLRVLIHSLADALLRPKDISEHPVSCPTDQMLFIASLVKDGYRSATYLFRLCSKLDFCFRSILLHIARLHLNGSEEYVSHSSALDLDCNIVDVDIEEEEEEEEIQDADIPNETDEVEDAGVNGMSFWVI
jgi:hypothetical protein